MSNGLWPTFSWCAVCRGRSSRCVWRHRGVPSLLYLRDWWLPRDQARLRTWPVCPVQLWSSSSQFTKGATGDSSSSDSACIASGHVGVAETTADYGPSAFAQLARVCRMISGKCWTSSACWTRPDWFPHIDWRVGVLAIAIWRRNASVICSILALILRAGHAPSWCECVAAPGRRTCLASDFSLISLGVCRWELKVVLRSASVFSSKSNECFHNDGGELPCPGLRSLELRAHTPSFSMLVPAVASQPPKWFRENDM